MAIPEFLFPMQGSLAGKSRAGIVTATGVGALRWRDGGALVEEASANLMIDPLFKSGRSYYKGSYTGSQDVTVSREGAPSLRMIINNPPSGWYFVQDDAGKFVSAGEPVSQRLYLRASRPGIRARAYLQFYAADNTGLETRLTGFTSIPTEGWVECSQQAVSAPANAVRFALGLIPDSAALPSVGDSLWLVQPQTERSAHHTTFIPEVEADGTTLKPGYAWTGAAHASTSTRAAASLVIPAASFPASLAIRYSEDMGATWHHAYLTAPGTFGAYGSVSYSGGNLTIAPSSHSVLIGGVRGDDRVLTAAEKARLEATPTWAWDTLIPRVAGVLRIGRDDGIGGLLRIGGQ